METGTLFKEVTSPRHEQKRDSVQEGISIIVCSYNGSKNIRNTLLHLFRQYPVGKGGEIIIVDNASTDDTARRAVDTWKELPVTIPFQVVREPKPGLSYARFRGAREASFSWLLFCDDDNLLDPDYCQRAWKTISENPSIGALGGCGVAQLQGGEKWPRFFKQIQLSFACGPQAPLAGLIDGYSLYGAGLLIKKEIFDRLSSINYHPILSDRSGHVLSSGGDEEMLIWTKIMGYQIGYDPELKFQHLIASERLQKKELIALYRGFGDALAGLVPLLIVLHGKQDSMKKWWSYQVLRNLYHLLKSSLSVFRNHTLYQLDLLCSWQRWSTYRKSRKSYYDHLEHAVRSRAALEQDIWRIEACQ